MVARSRGGKRTWSKGLVGFVERADHKKGTQIVRVDQRRGILIDTNVPEGKRRHVPLVSRLIEEEAG